MDRADELYSQAYAQNPALATVKEHVHVLIDARLAARAVTIAKAYYDRELADTHSFALYAEALIEAGQARDALEITDQLLQLDDQAGPSHALRGRALILNGMREEGIEELRQALQIDSRDAPTLMRLGEALLAIRRVDEAALQLRSAVKLDPENPRAYVLLGAALRDQKEIDDAKAALRRAIELDPNDGRPHFELGILYNQLAEQADAELALARAVQCDPDDTTYWYAYGQILHLRATQDPKAIDVDKLNNAIRAYRKSLDIQPPHPKAAHKLAVALLDANRHGEAEVMITGMLRANPNDAQSYNLLGALHVHAGNYKLAIDAYERYLTLAPKTDPDRERVKKAILELKRRL